ncbi:MAG: GNAT family N-acetyltransferase [Chitinophagales bacterium]|nr:GNAT family N-acetyltransferase [Chitinophagales bacterium]
MLTLNFTPFPVLYTEHLVLRAATPEDAAALSAIRSDARVNRYLERKAEMTHEEAENRIRRIAEETLANECIEWVIQLKEHPQMLGSICYWNIVTEADKAEIGYEMHPDYYGKGVMYEAMQRVIAYGFSEMKLKTIEAFPVKENIKSLQLLERNHFERDYDIDKYKLPENQAANTAVYILHNKL